MEITTIGKGPRHVFTTFAHKSEVSLLKEHMETVMAGGTWDVLLVSMLKASLSLRTEGALFFASAGSDLIRRPLSRVVNYFERSWRPGVHGTAHALAVAQTAGKEQSILLWTAACLRQGHRDSDMHHKSRRHTIYRAALDGLGARPWDHLPSCVLPNPDDPHCSGTTYTHHDETWEVSLGDPELASEKDIISAVKKTASRIIESHNIILLNLPDMY